MNGTAELSQLVGPTPPPTAVPAMALPVLTWVVLVLSVVGSIAVMVRLAYQRTTAPASTSTYAFLAGSVISGSAAGLVNWVIL